MSHSDKKLLAELSLNQTDIAEGLQITPGAVSKGVASSEDYLTISRLITIFFYWETVGDERSLKLLPYIKSYLQVKLLIETEIDLKTSLQNFLIKKEKEVCKSSNLEQKIKDLQLIHKIYQILNEDS